MHHIVSQTLSPTRHLATNVGDRVGNRVHQKIILVILLLYKNTKYKMMEMSPHFAQIEVRTLKMGKIVKAKRDTPPLSPLQQAGKTSTMMTCCPHIA